ncbi:MAG: HNH endonuclease signature motif containing protein [Bryobacteraceae bacterium]
MSHHVWEQHRGPIPPGHIVVFKDRDRSNCAIENLELISKAENARRNRMWNEDVMPRELAEVIQLNGVLKRKLREAYAKQQDH